MDHYQYRTTTTQAPLSPYNNLPFRATPIERIPIHTFSQPLAPTFHPYYSQTTVYTPARSIQTKVIGPPIACSVIQRQIPALNFRSPSYDINDIRKIDSQQLQLRRLREKQSTKQKSSIEQIVLKHQYMIEDLSRSNRKVKKENEQLKIQNTILLDKLTKISKLNSPPKIYEQKNNFKTQEVYETDADSFAYVENRIRRIRSFEQPNLNKQREQNYCEPCLVKCCTKCVKNVMGTKNQFMKHPSEEVQPKWSHYSDRGGRQQKNKWAKSTKQSKARPKQNYRSQASELDWAKQQDINAAIKRLKRQNKILKKYI